MINDISKILSLPRIAVDDAKYKPFAFIMVTRISGFLFSKYNGFLNISIPETQLTLRKLNRVEAIKRLNIKLNETGTPIIKTFNSASEKVKTFIKQIMVSEKVSELLFMA